MKLYIVQEIDEYKIYKVSDDLVALFEAEKKDVIIVQGNSIQDVLIAFDSIVKVEGLEFNSELAKYKSISKEQDDERITNKHQLKS